MKVFEYEVELVLTNTNAKEQRTITCTEYAYSPIDAVTQAHLNAARVAGSTDVAFLRVGPPARLVQAAALEIQQLVDEKLRSLLRTAE